MIIGIGGVSRSGKSKLAKQIVAWFPEFSMVILDQDDFVFPTSQIPKVAGETDWECPESINFDKYLDAVQEASDTYDWVIAEGLMAFYDERLVCDLDKKIFLKISYDLFVERKKLDKRWGAFPEWYIDHIWTSYLKYGQPRETEGYLVIHGDRPFPEPRIRDYLLGK